MSLENPHPVALDPPVAQAPPLARPILRDGIPDWDAITFDVFCSRCGYNLRTLTRPLCTECGLEFDWGIVLDRAVDRSLWQTSFLFEHLWLRWPIRSWFKTVWRSFRPRRFWGHVSIHDPIETQPLWFMMVMSIVAFIVVLHGAALLGTLLCGAIAMFISYPAPAFGYYSYSPVQRSCNSLLDLAVLPFDKPGEYLLLIGAACAVLLVTLILLCSLRQTLGRCRVRTAHVVRLVAYTATPVLVLSSLWIVGVTGLDHALPRDRFGTTWYLPLQLCFLLTPPALLVAYLGIGLKRYLMLPRPWLLAVVTVLVAFLFAATVVVVREVLTHGGYG